MEFMDRTAAERSSAGTVVDTVSIAGNAGNAESCTATLPGTASSTICVGEVGPGGDCPGTIHSESGRGSSRLGWPTQVDLATFSTRTFVALPGTSAFMGDAFTGGGTSYAAPHVTGAIVLWKHWGIARDRDYLVNTPGFVASAMLAMGDPYEVGGGDTWYSVPPLVFPDGSDSPHEMSNITGAGRFRLRNPDDNRVFYFNQHVDVLREGLQAEIRTPLIREERLNADRFRHVTWFHSRTYMDTQRSDLTAEVDLVSLTVQRDGSDEILQSSPQRVDWKARVNLEQPYLPDTDTFVSRITDAGPYGGDRPVYSTILIEDNDRRESWDQGHTWLDVFDARWWGTRRGTAPPQLTVLIDGEPEVVLSERSPYSGTPATHRIELSTGPDEAIFVDITVQEFGIDGHEATQHVRLARDRAYNVLVLGDELTRRPFEMVIEEPLVVPELAGSFHLRFVNGIPGVTADLFLRRNDCDLRGWCRPGEFVQAVGWRRPYAVLEPFVAIADIEPQFEEELFAAFIGVANPFLDTPWEADGRQIAPGDVYTAVLVADHDRPHGLFFGGGKLLFFRHRRAP